MKHIGKKELYFFPIVIFVFFINLHYYTWYDDGYKRTVDYFNNRVSANRFERIQSGHPYYEIYRLAKEYKGHENEVKFIFEERDPSNLDYTSTYHANRRNPQQKPVEEHLTELGLFIDYFFYPVKLPAYTYKEFRQLQLEKGNVIISDVDLLVLEYKNDPRIVRLPREKEPILGSNQKPVKSFYLYKVIK